MRVFTALIVGVCFAFGLSSFAASEKPKKVPVQIEIDEQLLSKLSPERRNDVLQIKALLEKRLYTYEHTDFELPPTIYDETASQIVELQSFFRAPKRANIQKELERIAADNKKLDQSQLDQIREEALFVVPSQEQPGENYVYKVGIVIQKGAKNIQITYDQKIDKAIDHLLVQVPDSVFGDAVPNITRGLHNLKQGLLETISLFIGLSETRSKYSDADIDSVIESERLRFQSSNSKQQSDWPLFNEELMAKALKIVSKIEQSSVRDWQRRLDQIRAEVKVYTDPNFTAHSVEEARVVEELAKSKQRAFFKALTDNAELNALYPGLGQILVDHGKAIQIVADEESSFAKKMDEYAADVEKEIREKYPLRSRIERWRNNKVLKKVSEYHSKNSWSFYLDAANKIEAAGLAKEAELLRNDILFYKAHAPELKEKLKEEIVGAREFEFSKKIWRKSRWAVKKDPQSGFFYVEKYRNAKVNTSDLFWRVQFFAERTSAWFNNGLYALIFDNLVNGPAGLRAAFQKEPFEYEWIADRNTGQLVRSGRKRATTVSLVNDLLEDRKKALAEFEQKNHGFFGRNFERALISPKVDMWQGALAPALTFVGKPVVALANLGFTAAAAATSIVWAPLSSLMSMGINAAIYDNLGTHYGNDHGPGVSRALPLLSRILGQFAYSGAAQTIGGIGSVALYHPGSAAAYYSMGKIQRSLRQAWDALMYKVTEKYGRVAGDNTYSFIVKRIAGPAISHDYYYQVAPDLMLAALWAQMEKEVFEQKLSEKRAEIREPVAAYNEFADDMMLLTGAQPQGNALTPALKQVYANVREQEKQLNATIRDRVALYEKILTIPDRNLIKLSAENLNNILQKGAILAQGFYSKQLESMTPDAAEAFWKERSLSANDWLGLAQTHFSDIFGKAILEPLEATDKATVVEVRIPALEEYARGLEKAYVPDQFDAAHTRLVRVAKPHAVIPIHRPMWVGTSSLCRSVLLPDDKKAL